MISPQIADSQPPQVQPSAAEAIRLVIWDLDETFWKGTLTEGGIELVEEHCAIVKTLAKRGIVSTICSKNDFEQIKGVLESNGVWEYFVLPSISWEPKGPRIQQLIQSIQLRPATVLFIDDNPLNLQEARRFEPELQVASQEIIAELLDHPLCKGKDDAELKRLNQYKLLELRKRDQDSAAGDVEDFLRASNIRVEINYDVLSYLDRALELITRTNQLNFTKVKVSSDPAAAREELRKLLGEYHVHAGLIRVVDRYGDHGYCGLYITKFMQARFVHFCFSCRILGMGVETWIYRNLGRPHLDVRGEVLSDVRSDRRSVDWITLLDGRAGPEEHADEQLCQFDRVGARGGCDLEALIHYFQPRVRQLQREFARSRNWFQVRLEHSMLFRYALEGPDEKVLAAYRLLGYETGDFETAYGQPSGGPTLWLLSFIVDNVIAMYRHRSSGVWVPFQAPGLREDSDARGHSVGDLIEQARTEKSAQMLRALNDEFVYEGTISEGLFKENLAAILDRAPPGTTVVLFLCNEDRFDAGAGELCEYPRGRTINRWMRDVAGAYPFVSFLDMRALVQNRSEMTGQFHFDRIVYHRAFKELAARFSFGK
jgi:FkbH-like protein